MLEDELILSDGVLILFFEFMSAISDDVCDDVP